jgi:anti-sigma factor RsiW
MKEANSESCAREQELIGFVYGELNEVERLAFQHHLNDCVSCSTELSGFRNVRESVVAWRNESLGSIGLSIDGVPSLASLSHQKHSALAAVREFLNLSPLWMKSAVAFAAVVFCVLAVMAVARLRDKQPVNIVAGPDQSIHAEQEIEAIVKQRVQEELARVKNSETKDSVASTQDRIPYQPVLKRGSKNIRDYNPGYSARRPLSKTEREQLAADLRLLSSNNDSDLDLLEDRINQ